MAVQETVSCSATEDTFNCLIATSGSSHVKWLRYSFSFAHIYEA